MRRLFLGFWLLLASLIQGAQAPAGPLPFPSPMFIQASVQAAPTATAHRYWRVYIGSNSDPTNPNNISLAEIELRESVGGSDATGSGTATGDSQFSGSFTPSMAFANDGNTTSWASTVTTHPHWIAYDFGSGVTKAIVEVAVMPRSTFSNQAPGAFKIQSSDDNWTTINDEWWVSYPGPKAERAPQVLTSQDFLRRTLLQE
jgi:hypothetical protein